MKIVKVTWLDTNENSVGSWIELDYDVFQEDDLFGRSQVIPKGVIKDIKYLD